MLTEDTLQKLLHGCHHIEPDSGGFRLHRFTSGQEALFAGDEKFTIRCLSTAGITFDFYTDSPYFRFDSELVLYDDRDLYGFDFYVDGCLVKSFHEKPVRTFQAHFDLPLPGGALHRVTIWFPFSAVPRLSGFELREGSAIEPVAPRKKYMSLGDSITQGFDSLRPGHAYPAQLAGYFGYELLNHAISGHVFDPRTLEENLSFQPDLITVAYGTNDWNKTESPSVIFRDAKAYLEKLTRLYPNAEIYAILPIWRADLDTPTQNGDFLEFRRNLLTLFQNYPGIVPVDGFGLVPHLPEFFEDSKLHPNDLGMLHYSRSLIQFIENNSQLRKAKSERNGISL